jgi:Cof subfamily protein (haloacid dehalogenase superfamily)
MRDKLSDMVGDTAVVVQAIPSSIEVLPPGASKGAGVARLLEDLGIAWANVLAIGDGENDIEMLQAAGIGVAMGNANELVKETADYVTNSNIEDGVAQALNRFIDNRPNQAK